MGLGSFPSVSLSDARAEREKWSAVVRDGKDPIQERQRIMDETARESVAAQAVPTFAEMVDIAFEARKARLRRDGEAGRWLSPLRLYVIPAIGNMPVTDITQTHIHAALKPIWRKMHPTAVKAIQRTRIVLTHARLSQFDVDPMICDAAEMMLGFVNHRKKPIPATPWKDVPDLYRRIAPDRSTHLVLRFAILTAMRSNAIRKARYEEVEGDVWTVPAERMKGSEADASNFRVPLSAAALEVIEATRELTGGSGFIFPSPCRGGKNPVSDVAVSKVLNVLGEAGRLHGFRTSFRTWAQDTEAASYDVAETALGHIVGNKVERSYARSDLLERRRFLMQRWADFVTMSDAKVVQFSR